MLHSERTTVCLQNCQSVYSGFNVHLRSLTTQQVVSVAAIMQTLGFLVQECLTNFYCTERIC
jgi:hypothetical protein